ncbi:MAG: M48 family metallopeptidase, partial [Alphaproteobacteria bacterium]|nr:M48 family metallopeptidase [Alphaproteobacteria bacterium]
MKITLLTGQTFNYQKHFGFEVKILKSNRAKRLTLRIDEKNHCPALTIPKNCSEKQAVKFLENNREWIINMLARLPQAQKFSDGASFSFFGKNYIIRQISSQKGGCFSEEELKIGGQPEFLNRRVIDFLKEQSLERLSKLTLEKAKILNCRVSGVSVKDTKSRWGSCSVDGNLNFNCLLVLMPPEILDSVVVHELCHRQHMNHSKEFYDEVLRIFPDY